MKKFIAFAVAGLLFTGASFASKGKKNAGKECCKEKKENCCKDSKSKTGKEAKKV